MTKDAKAAERQRLAEALRANLRRRKAAQGARALRETAEDQGRAHNAPVDDAR